MEGPQVETSFNALPVKLQVDILKVLNRTNIKSANLVCTYWYRLLSRILPPGFKLTNNNIECLQMLKGSFHSTIERLAVSNYTESLPISTSTRRGIPKAKALGLYPGNSAENIMKLLRSNAKYCKNLGIISNCFEKIDSFHLKGLAYECLCFLGIVLHQFPSNNLQDFGKRNHMIALIQFLKSTKFPKLKELRIKSPRKVPEENSTVQKFYEAIYKFFEMHGQKLTRLRYQCIPPSVVVNSFKYLYNLDDLCVEFNNQQLDQANQTQSERDSL